MPAADVVAMEECRTCGQRPGALTAAGHPRFIDKMAMGSLWKVHLMCMICGHAVAGKSRTLALQRWNEGSAPEAAYELPQDGADLVAADDC